MDHTEAVRQKSAERYLLNEMTLDRRDAFEQHFFDCPECAYDLRATAAFIEHAKDLLPQISCPAPALARPQKRSWFWNWAPAFAAPAFATLLAVVCYQNLVTLPAMRSEVNRFRAPQPVAWAALRPVTRGAAPVAVPVKRGQAFVLNIDLAAQATYASYQFELLDAQGRSVWTYSAAASPSGAEGAFPLLVPSADLPAGTYTLSITGLTGRAEKTEIDRRIFNLSYND